MANTTRGIPPITIDPNGYEGTMAIDSNKAPDFFKGLKSISLLEGEHFINLGSSFGGKTGLYTSYVYFSIDSNYEIHLYQTTSASLSLDKKTIILKTTPVTINVGDYQNNYGLSALVGTILSGKKGNVDKTGKLHIQLVSNQVYSFDSGIYLPAYSIERDQNNVITIEDTVGKSWFHFFVDDKGEIKFIDEHAVVLTASVHARFENRELTLKTVTVWIDPAEISNNAPIKLLDNTQITSGKEIAFLRGLLTHISWASAASLYYFIPM